MLVLRRNSAGLYGLRKRPLLGLSLPASVALSNGEPQFVRMCAIDFSRGILARSSSLLCVRARLRTNISIRMTISVQECLSNGR